VGRTEDGVFALAASRGIRLERGHPLPWLTKHGHLNPLLIREAPAAAELLARIHRGLGGDEKLLVAKSRGRDPLPDFLLPERRLIIEVDEIQHFTSDRFTTFDWYPADADFQFAVASYRMLIETWRQKADGYRATKPAPDFPRPGGRSGLTSTRCGT
jgi:hypothetical protein